MPTKNSFLPGITLIEMLIATPIALLVITSIVYLSVQLSNSSQTNTQMINARVEINRALSLIERDVSLSRKPLSKVNITALDSNNLLNAGVSNGSTSSQLILNSVATTSNADDLSISPRVARYSTPEADCTQNNPLDMNVVYFVYNNTLYRRIILPQVSKHCTTENGSKAGKPWQKSTCNLQLSSYDPACKDNDQALFNAAKMTITYKKLRSDGSYEILPNATNPSLAVASRQAAIDSADIIEITATSSISRRASDQIYPVSASISLAI